MKDELLNVLPELKMIADEELRGRCVDAFVDAMESAGWTVEDLDRIPFTLLLHPCPASFLKHTRSVAATALGIANVLTGAWPGEKAMEANRDLLLATALLHDIGKLLEYERDSEGGYHKSASGKLLRHPVSGAGLCVKHGLPDTVVHGVMYHSHEGDGIRATPEAIIVNHADFLNFEPLVLKYG